MSDSAVIKRMKNLVIALVFAIALGLGVILGRVASGKEWPTNYQQYNDIRSLAKRLHKGDCLMFTLNTGEIIYGVFVRYEKYTDYIWYQPQNTQSWWAQDAYEVHELFNLAIVEPL